MNESAREVYKAHREAQNRYIYFLLAAAGAAIALAVKQTEGLAIAWSQVPLAGAVSCWGLSFFFGCRHLGYVASSLYANMELLKVEGGIHPKVGTNVQMMEAAREGIRDALESNSDRANKFGHLQFRLLVTGGCLYLGWHILEMWLRRGLLSLA